MVAFNSTISFLLTSWSYLYGTAPPAPIVQTTYGQLEGAQSGESRAGRSYYEFYGVPFAKPPVGQLRFAPPQPPDTWEGVRQAKSTPYECIQYHIGRRVTGDEDCLYLNVFAHKPRILGAAGKEPNPTTEPETLAPVMVFLHGGIFMFGGGRIYGGRYIMDHDVVLVVVQYRVGALGFLNTGDSDTNGAGAVARGNMALKDQTMALRWVQDNIRAFGGDPARVTLVGQSAGAVCAHLHMLSPMSRGLFHQVILQSGNGLVPWGLKTKPVEQAQRFAARLGCPTNTSEAMVGCLRGLDATELVHGHDEFPYQLYDRLVVFGPTIESGGNDTDTFLDDAPLNLLRAGRAMDVPMMQGVNAVEGLMFAAKMIRNETVQTILASNWSEYAPKFFGLDDHPQRAEIVERVREFYLGKVVKGSKNEVGNWTDTPQPQLSMDNLLRVTDMLSDRNFFQPVHWLAEWNLERQNTVPDAGPKTPNTPAPMYLYFYTYKGEFSPGNFVVHLSQKLPQLLDIVVSIGGQWVSSAVFGTEPEHFGAGHADEIFMLYKVPILRQHEPGTKDYAMSKALVQTWADFVTSGAPKAGEACWEPVGKFCGKADGTLHSGLEYMKLDNDSHVIQEPFEDRIRFWESLGLNEKI